MVSGAQAEPFAFRGVQLGITLDEFRKTPHPDGKPTARVYCSGDKDTGGKYTYEGLSIEGDLKRIGVTTCAFMMPAKRGLAALEHASADFANVGEYTTRYHFTPKSFPAPLRERLYLVVLEPAAKHYSTIVDALTQRYGKPTDVDRFPTQTRSGAEFSNEIASWNGDGSQILMRKLGANINQSLIMYLHGTGSDAIDAAIKKIAAENAKKL